MILRFFSSMDSGGIFVFGLGLFVLLAVVAEAGFRSGRAYAAKRTPADKEMTGISALTGGMLALMAFVLAVTIGFAQDRFEARRDTTLTEANTIGTAWLRTDLAGPAGKPVAILIEDYARIRLSYIRETDPAAIDAALVRTNALQTEIWARAMKLLPDMQPPLAASLMPRSIFCRSRFRASRFCASGKASSEVSASSKCSDSSAVSNRPEAFSRGAS